MYIYSVHTHTYIYISKRKIKAVLPKNRLRQLHARHELGDGLLRHFAELEAGTVTDSAGAINACSARNRRDLAEAPPIEFFNLEDLPTLAEIEDLCLKQRPHRAPGLDNIPPEVCRHAASAIAPSLHNLVLKAFLQGIEPQRYKGGRLCPIWKQKHSRHDPSSYRGILLADCFGKVLHAWARQRLLPTLIHRRASGQIGGLPSQQTVTAIQILKLHGRLGRQRSITTSVIFVDLKAAFNHMLREYIFTVREPLKKKVLQSILDPKEFDIEQLAHDLREASQVTPPDMPAALRIFLHDLHKSTWFQLDADSDQVVLTDRGTRPGSPLADIGFNLLMARMMRQIEEELQSLPHYLRGCDTLGVQVPPISWVDDLAVPLATELPEQMPALMEAVVVILHNTFRSHGMTMNFESGKSEGVVMFRGRGANRCRTTMFDSERSPCIVAAADSHILTLKVVATYRHLGARFTMDADIEMEVQTRTGMARQAFHELKRAIFLNRHIPLKGRLQLYDSLIVSRLMYGCAVWSDVPAALLRRVEALLVKHYRSMANIGFWNDSHMTDDEIRLHLEVPGFRITWARHRLVFLQHLGKHALPFHRDLLLQEFQHGRGWLFEVQADLRWMQNLVDLPFGFEDTISNWDEVWTVLQTCRTWKSLVKRACRKHVLQERIARDVHQYHLLITEELNREGLAVWQGEMNPSVTQKDSYACPDCDRIFTTAQALGAHAFQIHGAMSDERQFVQSTICPGCLRDHHTTWRLQQHLRYRRNGCWDRVHGARLPDTPITIVMPPHLKHVKRMPAIRRHHGPLRPTNGQRHRIDLSRRIATLREAGAHEFAWWHPETDPDLVQRAFQLFRQGLEEWCACDSPDVITFHDVFFQKIFQLEVPDLLGGRLFVHWIEKDFHDAQSPDLDVDLIQILEVAHMDMLEDIPAWTSRNEMRRLTQMWLHRPRDEPELPPSDPVRQHRLTSYVHEIQSRYAGLGAAEQMRAHWRLLGSLKRVTPSKVGPYYIIHLYSGRRRSEDFHAMADVMLQAYPHLDVRVLSIDTAVDPSLNVHCERLWGFLLQIGRAGRILGLLQGPPCETWTAARHHQQFDAEGNALRGPRPLRTTEELWGIALLSCRELAQVYTGNVLLLKGLLLAVVVALNGGATILEHPAMPFADEISSIWRLGLLRLLLRGPSGPFRRITAEQWRLGSCGVKPTTFKYANCDLPSAILACQDPHAKRPTQVLLGKNTDGTYRTSKAKEYPPLLNRAFATAIGHAMQRWSLAPGCPEAESYGLELRQTAISTEYNELCPDYQPS